MYTTLLDMTSSDPDAMLTAIVQAQTGSVYTISTADQQLYRGMVNVRWTHPSIFAKFIKFIPRFGRMYMLRSCIGTLTISGLEEIMKAAFGGVPRMLSGKNFPQNVRAPRLLVE